MVHITAIITTITTFGFSLIGLLFSGWLVASLVLMALSPQTGPIVPQEYETYCVGPGDKTKTQ